MGGILNLVYDTWDNDGPLPNLVSTTRTNSFRTVFGLFNFYEVVDNIKNCKIEDVYNNPNEKYLPVISNPPKTKTANTKLLNDSCIPPDSMCPLVHPPAILAPMIRIKPPIKDQMSRFETEFPLYFAQLLCIIVILNSFLNSEITTPEINAPPRNKTSHCPGPWIFEK